MAPNLRLIAQVLLYHIHMGLGKYITLISLDNGKRDYNHIYCTILSLSPFFHYPTDGWINIHFMICSNIMSRDNTPPPSDLKLFLFSRLRVKSQGQVHSTLTYRVGSKKNKLKMLCCHILFGHSEIQAFIEKSQYLLPPSLFTRAYISRNFYSSGGCSIHWIGHTPRQKKLFANRHQCLLMHV